MIQELNYGFGGGANFLDCESNVDGVASIKFNQENFIMVIRKLNEVIVELNSLQEQINEIASKKT